MQQITSDTGRGNTRKGRVSQKTITRRGLRICRKDGQIRTLTGERWDVASESRDGGWCLVSFARDGPTCECPHRATARGRGRKHIAAVEQLLLISSETAPGKRTAIKEREIMCPDCKGQNCKRNGVYRGKYGDRQRYKRRGRGLGFRDNPGLGYRRVPLVYVTMAPTLSGTGSSVTSVWIVPARFKVKARPDTITRIPEHCSGMAEGYVGTIKSPRPGERWGRGGKRRKVRGRESWFVAVMHMATRFIPAWDTSPGKEKYDAAPLLQTARDAAGRVPRLFATDCPAQCRIAFNKVCRPARGLGRWHVRDVHVRNVACNTNTQERLNGESVDRFRSARGINGEDSPTFRVAVLHHNFVKPHGGMGGRTPAEAAGMDVQGADKWRTIMQNSVAAA